MDSFPLSHQGARELGRLSGERVHRPRFCPLSSEDPLEEEMATHASILA